MSIPKHKNPGYQDRVARAPYNFVPLPDAVLMAVDPPPQDRYDPDLLAGKLSCKLTTASPLFVRAAQELKEYKKGDKGQKPSDPFYGETKESLLIPGSSLRGMLRTLVEVVGQARIAPVTDKPLFFRTVDDTSIGQEYRKHMTGEVEDQGWYSKAFSGYMELRGSDYFIRPVRQIMGVQHFKVEEEIARKAIPALQKMAFQRGNGRWSPDRDYEWDRYEIWFKPTTPSQQPKTYTYFSSVTEVFYGDSPPAGVGWVKGWLIASGWVPSRKGSGKRRHWIIGPPDHDDSKLIRVDDDDIELYQYHGGLTQANKKLSVLPESGEPVPCFYIPWKDQDGCQRVAFGHTGMFRLPYELTPADFVPETLQDDETQYDLAEAMFGFVDPKQKGKRKELAGRVFITDAIFKGNPKTALLNEITLSDQALSSPKPTTFQHYLTQDNPDNKDRLKHYGDSKAETTLRGHKFYWHLGGEAVQQRLKDAPKPRPNTNDKGNRFKPVKAGQIFTFDIHFENLRLAELGALLWVLDKAADPQYRLKLGMGKPFGLGSIRITYTPHITDRESRYGKLFSGESWNQGPLPPAQQDQKLSTARQAFNQFVTGDTTGEIDTLPRIQELLVMLEWREDDPGWANRTRYMLLGEFTGNRNPEKNPSGVDKRPVLPIPSKVADFDWFKRLPDKAPEPSKPGGEDRETSIATTILLPPELPPELQKVDTSIPRDRAPEPELPKPVEKQPSDLIVGEVILATIDDAPGKGEITLIPEIHGPEDLVVIPADRRSFTRYKEGEKMLVRVIHIEGDDENGWYIEAEPVL